MSPEVQKMTEEMVSLTAFISSPAHTGYVNARQKEIEEVKNRILMTPPISQDFIAIQLRAFGELETLEDLLTTFEDAARTLKARIDETVERENQAGTTMKI